LLTQIPQHAFDKFSQPERSATLAALREGQHIYCTEVVFEAANFADRYRNLRKVLSEKSEIIASLPSEKHRSANKIGFQIFLASREPVENLRALVKDFDAEISSHACTENASNDLFKMLSHAAVHAQKIAEKAGKEVRVSILANDAALSAETTRVLFDILLQLIRNSVDHAIEQSGTIEIRLFEAPEGLHLSVADDGRGIDLQKVRARAVAKNLISDDDLLDEQQTRALVFAPELSTAERVTETSGRGVGLDAVKAAVENLHGKISLQNRKTSGTIFEIFLPR
jgi:sensor histidine kinase regulating citrate/malate metabolism